MIMKQAFFSKYITSPYLSGNTNEQIYAGSITLFKNNFVRMKKTLIYLLTVSLFLGCQSPDDAIVTDSDQSITRLTAIFASGDYSGETAAEYTITDASVETITIPIPWYYPKNSDNETTSNMTAIKVQANLANNCSLEPILEILDLTVDNYFTLTNPLGVKKQICIKGERVKSDECSILAFSIVDPAITGVIDQDEKTISIISTEDLSSCLAEYTLSAHASISPDPATTSIDLSGEGVNLTVTADNGISSTTYRVVKNIPAKLPLGLRSGSGTSLYALNAISLGMPTITSASAPSLAVLDKYLIVNFGDGTTPIYLNKATGASVGTITLGSASATGCVTSDVNNNMLICNYAASGEMFNVYKTTSVSTAPSLLFSYTNTSGQSIGNKVSVQGDLSGDAIIIATCENSGSFIRWIVTGGIVGSPVVVTASGVSTWGGIDNVPKIASYSTTYSDGYFIGHYDSGNDNVYFVNGSTNTASSHLTQIGDGNDWGRSNGLIDVKEFNNARYMVMYSVSYFPMWGIPCGMFMYDVTSVSSFGNATVDKSSSIVFSNTSVTSYNDFVGDTSGSASRTGDILLYPSSDGYMLDLYYIDNVQGVVGCYEFDCIDK